MGELQAIIFQPQPTCLACWLEKHFSLCMSGTQWGTRGDVPKGFQSHSLVAVKTPCNPSDFYLFSEGGGWNSFGNIFQLSASFSQGECGTLSGGFVMQSFGRKSFSEELKQLSFFQTWRNPGAGPGPSCSSAEKEGDLGISSRARRRREQGPTNEKLDISQLRIFRIIIVD